MFENIGTAIVQAVGFFGVFGFFVYQLLFDDKKPVKTKLKSSSNKINKFTEKNEIPKKKGLFGRKKEPMKEELKPKKKSWFK